MQAELFCRGELAEAGIKAKTYIKTEKNGPTGNVFPVGPFFWGSLFYFRRCKKILQNVGASAPYAAAPHTHCYWRRKSGPADRYTPRNGGAGRRLPYSSLKAKEPLNKSPRTSRRQIFRLSLPQNLEIHQVFLRFWNFDSQKICSPIRHVDLIRASLKL